MTKQSDISYQVWFDLSCDDFLALPAAEMTAALSAQLSKEGVEVKTVEAATRQAAVKKAFPKKTPATPASTLVAQSGPKPSRH